MGLSAIGAIFSGLIGFLIAGANNITFDGHDHSSDQVFEFSSHGSEEVHLQNSKNLFCSLKMI